MSNRQKATGPRVLRRAPRPAGVVHSASHGATEFHPPAWFKAEKVKPCRAWKDCGIKSLKTTPHFHPGATS